ncbi:MAG: hypothetical protein IJH87_03285, partial [Atopobiaceae bacterium]|nr:hypothetical protein [Atopobiaceae bacterium]
LIALSREEMRGEDPEVASALRWDIELHMHEEFADEVGPRWFLTRGLFEPGHEGTVALDGRLISALPSSEDARTYLCNIFSYWSDSTIRPLDDPAWTGTSCLADAILKCLDDPFGTLFLGALEVVSERASDCGLSLPVLCEELGISRNELGKRCMAAQRTPGPGELEDFMTTYAIAENAAEVLLDPYEVADAAGSGQTPDEAWDDAVHEIELQLRTPSGRASVLEGLRAELDDDGLSRSSLDLFSECIHSLGPVAGFPLGQTVVTHGFMATNYVRATLDASEQEALAGALAEVLSEEYGADKVRRLVEEAMDGRIADISCMDAAGFVNRLREADDSWRRFADPAFPGYGRGGVPDEEMFCFGISGEERWACR